MTISDERLREFAKSSVRVWEQVMTKPKTPGHALFLAMLKENWSTGNDSRWSRTPKSERESYERVASSVIAAYDAARKGES